MKSFILSALSTPGWLWGKDKWNQSAFDNPPPDIPHIWEMALSHGPVWLVGSGRDLEQASPAYKDKKLENDSIDRYIYLTTKYI